MFPLSVPSADRGFLFVRGATLRMDAALSERGGYDPQKSQDVRHSAGALAEGMREVDSLTVEPAPIG